jgi:hypothetical protein
VIVLQQFNRAAVISGYSARGNGELRRPLQQHIVTSATDRQLDFKRALRCGGRTDPCASTNSRTSRDRPLVRQEMQNLHSFNLREFESKLFCQYSQYSTARLNNKQLLLDSQYLRYNRQVILEVQPHSTVIIGH